MGTFVKAGLAGCADKGDVEDIEDFDDIHNAACVRGEKFYTDPTTGYLVMSEAEPPREGQVLRGRCRHCPYNHVNVKDKASRIQNPALMRPAAGFAKRVTVLAERRQGFVPRCANGRVGGCTASGPRG